MLPDCPEPRLRTPPYQQRCTCASGIDQPQFLKQGPCTPFERFRALVTLVYGRSCKSGCPGHEDNREQAGCRGLADVDVLLPPAIAEPASWRLSQTSRCQNNLKGEATGNIQGSRARACGLAQGVG